MWKAAFLSVLCLLTVAGRGVAQEPPVVLHLGANGSGAGQPIPVGTYRVDGNELAAKLENGGLLSVVVAKGHRIRFCENVETGDAAGARCEEFAQGTHNLKSTKFVVIRVWSEAAAAVRAAIMVFEQPYWRGRSQAFGTGMYRSIRGEFGQIADNKAMSVIVGKGFRARFCASEGDTQRGTGDCEEHDEGRHNLRFATSISFIEVKDLSDKSPEDEKQPVVLYEDEFQVGKRQGFDVGTFPGDQLGKVGNDQASSIAVKSGYRAQVCADITPAADRCEEFGPGKHNFRQREGISYLRVWKGSN